MNVIDVAARIRALPTAGAQADLNDWAVNTIREYFYGQNWSRDDMLVFVNEECSRIARERLDLIGYLRCRREGSAYPLHRGIRVAMFVLWATTLGRHATWEIAPAGASL